MVREPGGTGEQMGPPRGWRELCFCGKECQGPSCETITPNQKSLGQPLHLSPLFLEFKHKQKPLWTVLGMTFFSGSGTISSETFQAHSESQIKLAEVGLER